jgi:hypothetical protein
MEVMIESVSMSQAAKLLGMTPAEFAVIEHQLDRVYQPSRRTRYFTLQSIEAFARRRIAENEIERLKDQHQRKLQANTRWRQRQGATA